MGYSTDFNGELTFKEKITEEAEQKLLTILGEDIREHADWLELLPTQMTWIDLELTDDGHGLRWNGSEKTYDLPEKVNYVIDLMAKFGFPISLEGEMLAQGEDMNDRWMLVMEDGRASMQDFIPYTKDTVAISKTRLAELEKAEETLAKLFAAGVDNWDGYEMAMEE